MVSNAVVGEEDEEIKNKDREQLRTKRGHKMRRVPLKTLYTHKDAALFLFLLLVGNLLEDIVKTHVGVEPTDGPSRGFHRCYAHG